MSGGCDGYVKLCIKLLLLDVGLLSSMISKGIQNKSLSTQPATSTFHSRKENSALPLKPAFLLSLCKSFNKACRVVSSCASPRGSDRSDTEVRFLSCSHPQANRKTEDYPDLPEQVPLFGCLENGEVFKKKFISFHIPSSQIGELTFCTFS